MRAFTVRCTGALGVFCPVHMLGDASGYVRGIYISLAHVL